MSRVNFWLVAQALFLTKTESCMARRFYHVTYTFRVNLQFVIA